MRLMQFVRMSMPLAMLGLAGLITGCSGSPPSAAPVNQEEGKQIAADMKTARQAAKKERSQTGNRRRH